MNVPASRPSRSPTRCVRVHTASTLSAGSGVPATESTAVVALVARMHSDHWLAYVVAAVDPSAVVADVVAIVAVAAADAAVAGLLQSASRPVAVEAVDAAYR